MSAAVRPLAAADIPSLLPLVEQYWLYEDITHFDPARVAQQLKRLCDEPSLGSGWIAGARGGLVGYLLAMYVFTPEDLVVAPLALWLAGSVLWFVAVRDNRGIVLSVIVELPPFRRRPPPPPKPAEL